MAIPGFFGGGMMAVALAKLVGQLQRCRPTEGMPACNFEPYLMAGGMLGAIVLPAIVLWRLRGGGGAGGVGGAVRDDQDSHRG